MNVTSSGIINGVIQPQYGGHGTQFNDNGIPTYSLPFAVEDAPHGTVSVAIVLEDKDAYPPGDRGIRMDTLAGCKHNPL